jgi:hypothetical protein
MICVGVQKLHRRCHLVMGTYQRMPLHLTYVPHMRLCTSQQLQFILLMKKVLNFCKVSLLLYKIIFRANLVSIAISYRERSRWLCVKDATLAFTQSVLL